MIEISVITPAFNAEKYIISAIASVEAQNMPGVEMIIIDDNSTDSTWQLLGRAQRRYDFIKIFHNKKNMGPAFCRNLAIRKSRGKYIAFLDADDLWLPDKLKIQISYMKEHKVQFSYSSYIIMNNDGVTTTKKIIGKHNLNFERLLLSCPIGCLTVIYEKKKFKPTYMPNVPRGQDYGLWLKLFRQKPKVGYIEEPLGLYRKTDNSISSAKTKKIMNMFELYHNHLSIGLLFSLFYTFSHILHSFLKSHGITHTKEYKTFPENL
jgi:teichuronic acid biosynthesis glycosyltransferase TuaG